MTEFVAAILIEQLKRFPPLADKRRTNANLFRARLNAIPGLTTQRPPAVPCLSSNYLIQARLIAPGVGAHHRDRLVELLLNKGIPVNRVYPPLFELDAYWKWPEPGRTIDDLRARCPNARLIGETALSFHHRLLLSDTSVIENMAETVGLAVAEVLGTR
jgi:3-amino-5-hydroxybenzoate synthase